MAEASIEELKELTTLVRCGRLYDVQAWLAAGKPFRTLTAAWYPIELPSHLDTSASFAFSKGPVPG
jgi:hypothetical protein